MKSIDQISVLSGKSCAVGSMFNCWTFQYGYVCAP